jgi:hypothetical protein
VRDYAAAGYTNIEQRQIFAPGDDAFTVTVADLHARHRMPVARCLASYRNAWDVPDNHGQVQNARQEQVYCVYALSRLRVLTADEMNQAPPQGAAGQ